MDNSQFQNIATKLTALINKSVSSRKVVPILEAETLLRPLQIKGASSELVLTITRDGYTPHKQTLGYGLPEQVARNLAKAVHPNLSTLRAGLAVEQR